MGRVSFSFSFSWVEDLEYKKGDTSIGDDVRAFVLYVIAIMGETIKYAP